MCATIKSIANSILCLGCDMPYIRETAIYINKRIEEIYLTLSRLSSSKPQHGKYFQHWTLSTSVFAHILYFFACFSMVALYILRITCAINKVILKFIFIFRFLLLHFFFVFSLSISEMTAEYFTLCMRYFIVILYVGILYV